MRDILLVNLEGLVYGIWENEVLSVEEPGTIHRLPGSPPAIAGVTVMHDRAVTLADLSVCIGHAPLTGRSDAEQIFIMSDKEKLGGFLVGSGITQAAVPSNDVYSLPDYLKTPVIDSCVVINAQLVPVVNISMLYDRVRNTDHKPAKAEFTVSGAGIDLTNIEKIRLFEINGERFGASAAGMEERAVSPGEVRRLNLTPPFVSGIAFHRGHILPVIDPASRLGVEETGKSHQMLVAELGGTFFGFLINADNGIVKEADFPIKRLPPIAESAWLRGSITSENEIVPLLDLGALISIKHEEEQPLPQRYKPDSDFSNRFNREDVEVMEYSLLGQRHAFPRSEVKDDIGFIPYRRIPNAPPIVIGIAGHNDTLLPVLDLAMVFGRRSLATPEWRMLRVENGDFQALVITEAVFGERPLPLADQRAVPIQLPHCVVYGCYPDADAVRLILNVEAMAVHFEKALVRELLSAMSPEMKQAPAEIVPSLFEEDEAPSDGVVVSEALQEQPVEKEPAAALQPIETAEVAPVLEQPAVPEVIEAAQVSAEIEKAGKDTEERARHEAEEQAKREAEAKALREAEEQQRAEAAARAAEEERIRKEAEERARREAEEHARQEAQEQAIREAEEQAREEAAAKVLREAEERQKAEATRAAEEERIRKEAEEQARQESEELARREAAEQAAVEARRKDEAEKKEREEAAAVVREAKEIARRESEKALTETATPATLSKSTGAGAALREALSKPAVRRKSFVSLVIIGVVILAFLYSVFRKPSVEVKGPKAPVETAQKKTKGPLVLTVPAGVPLEPGTYVVKEGDTLWGISKRFTGNPFNYPSIAGENDIPNPDLIFPEQEIIVKKKE